MSDEAEADAMVPVKDLMPATVAEVEAVRQDIAQRLAALTPKTSATATDVVAILKAIQGTPDRVSVTSPSMSSDQYNAKPVGGWSIEVTYARPVVALGEDNQ